MAQIEYPDEILDGVVHQTTMSRLERGCTTPHQLCDRPFQHTI